MDRNRTIVSLFETQVRQSPDAVAVLTADQTLTYFELNARANQVARLLCDAQVSTETLVGVCLERSVDLVVTLLGIMKVGGVYVPLDPNYPSERLAFVAQDTKTPVLLTCKPLLSRLSGVGTRTVCLDHSRQELSRYPTDNLSITVSANNLAFVLYTSGSAGRPKGVLMEHKGFCNLVAIHQQAFGLGHGSRVLLFGAPSHGNAVIETVVTLSTGATLCVEPYESLLPGPALVQVLRERAITHLHIPPTALAALPVEPLPSLRVLTVGGEPLPKWVMSRWARGRRFFNTYGTTETNWLAFTELQDDDDTKPVPVGQPIGNMEAYIVDTDRELVPKGTSGELCIGGIGLARGYLNQPELSAEKFVPNPFSKTLGATVYRTGDRACQLPNGCLALLGRLDQQISIRGFRIEPGEIEALLTQHPFVSEAIVIAHEESSSDHRLWAYLVMKKGSTPTANQLRGLLAQKLPAHMIPATFMILDHLPLLANGKLDRKALPKQRGQRLTPVTDRTAPRTSLEELLAEVWREILKVEPIGVHDNFFELGGHSLLATQVVVRLRNILELDIPLLTLFEHSTVAQLAQELDKQLEKTFSHDPRDEPLRVRT